MTQGSYQVFVFQVPSQAQESFQGELYSMGCLGLVEKELENDQKEITAYFPAEPTLSDFVWSQTLKTKHLIQLQAKDFKSASFDPYPLTPGVKPLYQVVAPPDLEGPKQAGDYDIIIRPGMAFGTGRHESTQLASLQLLDFAQKHSVKNFLDVGSGSGILSLLAHRLGIKKISAVEIDPDARDNALENFDLNHVTHIQLKKDLKEVEETFDLVIANIIAPTLIQLKEQLINKVKTGGHLILSGIVQEEINKIKESFKVLKLIKEQSLKEWQSFLYQKS
ncbi:MAG: 50S ribosomal protein L11 methyltransferase [Deltaproteobacteria bacterium]|nr:50S ribosomal protein L11 methyltransferase [Deltaproteobacteria bacterium]